MTSVPKPLKFLRNQYDPLKIVYEKITDKTTKVKQTTSNDILKFYYSDYFQYYKGILRRRFVSSWYDDKREAWVLEISILELKRNRGFMGNWILQVSYQ